MDQENNKPKEIYTKEEMDNVVGLFEVLLKIDKRKNPEKYKTIKEIDSDKTKIN